MEKVEKLKPFRHFCMSIGELPSSYLETMSYYEMLLWFTRYLQNTVIPTINNNATATQELQSLFIELKNYVDNYFENLDVQDEINNKLDEMAEDGTLADIISQYLQFTFVYGFDTINDMKLATSLHENDFVKTYGFYSLNDGGGANYKVRLKTNDDVIDNIKIIELNDNNLVAELLFNIANVKQFGCYGDGIHDDTDYLKLALTSSENVFLPKGEYLITDTLEIEGNKLFGEQDTTLLLNANINLFDINFNSKIENLNIKNLVSNYSKSIFEMSSRTFKTQTTNFANIEISHINLNYFDEQPTTSNGNLFLIYASKDNFNSENNSVLGFWGIKIHDIISFQYFKNFIKQYVTFTDDVTPWCNGIEYYNIQSMRNEYFFFGKYSEEDTATGLVDGDDITFRDIQVQYDAPITKYGFYFTSGFKKLFNVTMWDFPNAQISFVFEQQNTNTVQQPIYIDNQPYEMDKTCKIIGVGYTYSSLMSLFDYKLQKAFRLNTNNNLKSIFLSSENQKIYYFLGRYLKNEFIINLNINRDPNSINSENTCYGVSIRHYLEGSISRFKISSRFGGVHYQHLPVFYYKEVAEDGISYIELYMSKWGGNGTLTTVSNDSFIGQVENNGSINPINPEQLTNTPTGITEITNIYNLSSFGVKNIINDSGSFANFGAVGCEQSTRQVKCCTVYGWLPFNFVYAGSSDPTDYLFVGMQFFNTSTNKLKIWNGSSWIEIN